MAENLTVAKVHNFLKDDSVPIKTELYDNREKGLFIIKLAKGGSWRYRFVFNGRRYRHTLGSADMKPEQARELAQQWRTKIKNEGVNPLAEIQAKMDEQTQKIDQRRLVKVGVFFEEIYTPHLLKMSHSGKDTLNTIKSNFSHIFDRDMDRLTTADLRAWEHKRLQEGALTKNRKGNCTSNPLSRATLVRALSAFKAMINFAAGKKKRDQNDAPVILFNPISDFKLSPKTAVERDESKSKEEALNLKRDLLGLTDRELIKVGLVKFAEYIKGQRRNSRSHGKSHLKDLDADVYPHWFIPFCHVARLTGMRPSDIRRIRWSDIRSDARTNLKVLKFTPNKTSHHENPIEVNFPITDELDQVLYIWRHQHACPDVGLIFPSERTGGIMDKKAYLRHWSKVKELAGVRADIDFYCFRHNFISDLVSRNFPLLSIAKLVGHKSTAMIERNYFKTDLDDMALMAKALSDGYIDRNDIN